MSSYIYSSKSPTDPEIDPEDDENEGCEFHDCTTCNRPKKS